MTTEKQGKPVLSRANMTTFKKEPSWRMCPGCEREISTGGFGPQGLCLECTDSLASIREKKVDRKMAEFVGDHGALRFTAENFKFKDSGLLRWFENFDPWDRNAYLYGPAGTGKTHLAAAVVRKFLNKMDHNSILFKKVPKLLRWFQGRRGYEQDGMLDRLSRCNILVLDDLGIEKDSDFSARIIYEILDDRISAGRNGLIVTTNFSPSDLAQRFGDDRVTSRLFGMCETVKFAGDDWRIRNGWGAECR